MRRKIGLLFMILGAVLVLAALSLCLINQRENNSAGAQAEKVAQQLEEQIHSPDSSVETEPAPLLPDPFDPTMAEKEIDGYLYVGMLNISSLDISLPVMSTWSYPQLKIAPCRYSGSSKTDDLVIAGHNYARHFGPLKNLAEGDTLSFTDVDGYTIEYMVMAVEVLQPTDIENMTAGEFDLTLFTCTYGGQSRVTVRCDRVENERK